MSTLIGVIFILHFSTLAERKFNRKTSHDSNLLALVLL